MKSQQASSRNPSIAKRWAVVSCLLLVGLAITAQAFHLHPNDLADDAKHCAVCQVAHAPVQVAPVAQLNFALSTKVLFSLSPDPDPKQGEDSFSLFCRPPPAV